MKNSTQTSYFGNWLENLGNQGQERKKKSQVVKEKSYFDSVQNRLADSRCIST